MILVAFQIDRTGIIIFGVMLKDEAHGTSAPLGAQVEEGM